MDTFHSFSNMVQLLNTLASIIYVLLRIGNMVVLDQLLYIILVFQI